MLDRIEQLMRGEVSPLEATERHANPMGTVHGGILADAAMGMAFTTLELKINFMRRSGPGSFAPRGACSPAAARSGSRTPPAPA